MQSWCRYLKAQLGGPTRGEYEAVKAENEELKTLVEQLRQLVPEQPPAQASLHRRRWLNEMVPILTGPRPGLLCNLPPMA